MNAARSAIVVGGGIAGSATAMALTKAGLDTVVLEAREAGKDLDGVMLNLAVNGITALRAIDAEHRVLDLGFATSQIGLRTHTGKRLGATHSGVLPDGTTSRTLRRADLNAALREEAQARGVSVEQGKRLEHAEETPSGVRAVLTDGTTVEADILVGADGVHSAVRSQIDPHAPAPSYVGLVGTGGYAGGVSVDVPTGDYEMIFGKRAFFGYAAAHDGTVWWFVNVPHSREPARGEVQAVAIAEWRRRLSDLYVEDTGPALELIAASPDFAPMTPIHTMPHLPRWHTDRMIVVGDAAHAPSPTSGQGASLSIEDAVALATALRDHDSTAAAFAHFEATRRPRVEKIIKAAARINNHKAPGACGRLLRDLTLPTILRLTADTKSSREIHQHRLDWDTPPGDAAGC
jgi:2-polyprenyl-6-methoxyphenol hydroxylase-like FAD-dependent oxidoreductase